MQKLKKLWPLAWAKTVRFLEDQLAKAEKQGNTIDRMYSVVKRELNHLENELYVQSKASLEREVALDEELRAAYKESAARLKRLGALDAELIVMREENQRLKEENQKLTERAFGHLTWRGPTLVMERMDFHDSHCAVLRLPECRLACSFSNTELTQMKSTVHHFSEILAKKLHDQLLEDLPKLLARG